MNIEPQTTHIAEVAAPIIMSTAHQDMKGFIKTTAAPATSRGIR